MKNLISNFAIIIALFTVNVAIANGTTALTDTSDNEMIFGASRTQQAATGAFGEVVGSSKGAFLMDVADEAIAPELVRKPKMLADNFTGYTIELATVFNKPLELTDEMFKFFGGIKIEKRSDNSYTYLLGNFETKTAMETYMSQIVLAKFPNAKGAKYKKGNQVTLK